MADAESISLEETNKIRISLGLKPLTDDSAPVDNKEKQAEENYAERKRQEQRERETTALAAKIAKNRNKRELNRRLVGATLADDDGDDDTLKWIKRSKKKEKELAKKRQLELENRDAVFAGEEYSEKDLEGLKVSHDFDVLEEGEARILTLKDSRILDNEEDELQNIDLAETEKDKKRQELKTKRRDYTGYDDDEFGENVGVKRGVLTKYDEDISGAPETGFRLGAAVLKSQRTTKDVQQEAASAVNKSLLSIDYAKNQEISDYIQENDVGFKKPKTKKKKSSRRAPIEAELAALSGETETPVNVKMEVEDIVPRTRDLDANFIDDDELQAALARSRRQKVAKAPKLTPEDIAKRIAEEKAEEEERRLRAVVSDEVDVDMNDTKQEDEVDGGLTFDDTTEFVRAISYNPIPKAVPAEPIIVQIKSQRSVSPERHGISKTQGDVDLNEIEMKEEGEASEGEVDEDGDAAMLAIIEDAIKSAENQEVKREEDGIGTTEESFGGGMAGTLSILRKQGLLSNAPSDVKEREAVQKQHDRWLADHRHRLAQREMERLRSKNSNKDQATREYENRQRELQEARETVDAFKNYKPDVDIKYHDEFGREMTPKEAWKALSHRFHGKGSGRMKTEKRLKKIADEKKREAMVSGDTPTSMNQAFQKRQEKAGQAHMVLSVGNRGAVPQLEEFLDNAALSKNAKAVAAANKGKGKRKDDNNGTASVDITGFVNANIVPLPAATPQLAAPGSQPSSVGGSPAPTGSGGMMKPAFVKLNAVAAEAPGISSSSPALGGTKVKIQVGLGTKRKALDEGLATPPSKR
ncbi:hypothetical protein FRC02_000027 [Tulasnella sp. 418]|nr:hypothetical protein FRC02_000027 [Tulasnella sp. 418]